MAQYPKDINKLTHRERLALVAELKSHGELGSLTRLYVGEPTELEIKGEKARAQFQPPVTTRVETTLTFTHIASGVVFEVSLKQHDILQGRHLWDVTIGKPHLYIGKSGSGVTAEAATDSALLAAVDWLESDAGKAKLAEWAAKKGEVRAEEE